MGRWKLLIPFLHLILHVSSNSAFTPVKGSVKGTVTLPCSGAVSKDTPPQEHDVKWVTAKNILVAHYQQGELTVGDLFKDRVNISEDDIRFGNFSLKISPVEYSDGDLYMCFSRGEHLGDVKLEVFVPTDVSARLGEPATLPCYVPVDKTQRSNTDTVHWEKDGQTVLLLQSGSSNKSSGFENRYSMSVDKVRFGDLSLTISKVRYSDQGTYQCFSTEKTVKPDIINLIIEAHYNSTSLQSGQSLWLQLYSSEPVRVVFQPNENSSTVPVCTVKGESADCVPQYQHRVSIQNTALKLDSVTPLDNGVYRVIDHKTNKNISVTVLTDPPATAGITWPGVLLGVLLGVLGVLGVKVEGVKRCFRRPQMQPVSQRNIAEDSEPLRQRLSLAPSQPVQENGEEEQLRASVCESGDTEDKRGPQPWNDSSHCKKVWAPPNLKPHP
ncbi:uncharacterized protein [Paramormyrops kingsleyae]|uniref:uncharacterized protein n=1 Tax=Paramormyrops kingsleyae TaxID=1676925 RepID=UPI003B96FFAC